MSDIRKYVQIVESSYNLKEDVIKIPDSLYYQVNRFVFGYIGYFLYHEFNNRYHDRFTVNGHNIVDNVYQFDINDKESVDADRYKIDVSDVPYTDKVVDVIYIGVQRYSNNSGYLPDHNLLNISIKEFVDTIEDKHHKVSDPDEQEMVYELDGTIDLVNDMLDKLHKELNGIIRHELTHFIQVRYLSKKHPKQGLPDEQNPLESSMSDYFNSDIEFSAYITTAIETYKANIQKLKPSEYKEYFKYLVGMDHESKHMLRIDVSDRTIREFFLTLKEHNPSKYKKAIKYFIKNI